MSNVEKGVISKVNERDGTYGKMYSIQVNGQWYSAGKYPLKVREGDYVEFDWIAKGQYRNAEPKTIRLAAPTATVVTGGSVSAAPAAPFVDKRQDIISAQWGVNAAIQTVAMLREMEALPGLKKTASADEKYDYVKALILEVAGDYVFLATGKGLPEHVAKATGLVSETPADGEWK